jgi:hypothetical protein
MALTLFDLPDEILEKIFAAVGPHALIVFSAGLGCVVFQGILLILMQVSRESRRLVFSFQNLVLDFRDVTAMSSKGQQHMLRSVHIPTDGEKSMNCDIFGRRFCTSLRGVAVNNYRFDMIPRIFGSFAARTKGVHYFEIAYEHPCASNSLNMMVSTLEENIRTRVCPSNYTAFEVGVFWCCYWFGQSADLPEFRRI